MDANTSFKAFERKPSSSLALFMTSPNSKLPRTSQTRTIRIISGRWRGRKLSVLDQQGLRPTGDRVKEMLFNWLAPCIAGSHCLDAFAGTGGLGLECLSRGAEHVTFLETNRRVAQQYTLNPRLSTHDRTISTRRIRGLRQHIVFRFDFLDPPFEDDCLSTA